MLTQPATLLPELQAIWNKAHSMTREALKAAPYFGVYIYGYVEGSETDFVVMAEGQRYEYRNEGGEFKVYAV